MAAVVQARLPEVRLNDRIAIFGRTGTGKSILAHLLFKTIPIPQTKEEAEQRPFWRLAIDVTDSIFEPESLTFYDPDNIPWDDAFSLRFVPDARKLEDSIDALYMSVMVHGDCWCWLDEANEVSTAHRTIFGLRKVLLQGRKFQIGQCSVTPRPVDIARTIITQSEHFFIFPITENDDRVRIAKTIGLTIDEFEISLANLPEYGYLWYSLRDDIVFTMPPIPERIAMELEGE